MDAPLKPANNGVKPLPILPHMPWHVKENIVRRSSTEDKFSIRCCSKEFKELVNQSCMQYNQLKLYSLSHEGPVIKVKLSSSAKNSLVREFHKTEQGCLLKNSTGDWQKLLLNTEIHLAAAEFFLTIVTKSQLKVKNLNINLDSCLLSNNQKTEIWNFLRNELNMIGRKMSVQKFEVYNKTFLRLLPFMEPGTLEELNFVDVGDFDVTDWLANSEQWKKSKRLRLFLCTEIRDYSVFKHFQRLLVYVDRIAQHIVNTLLNAFLENPKLVRHRISYHSENDDARILQLPEQFHRVYQTESETCYRHDEGRIEIKHIRKEDDHYFELEVFRF